MTDTQKPYAPPAEAPPVEAPPGPPPEGRLYTPEQVGMATFLGSVIAGVVLMAINYQRLGKPKAVAPILVAGVFATAAVLVIAFVLPEGTGYVLPVATVFALTVAAKKQQGEPVALHVALGGKIEPWWKAAGIGVAGLVVMLGVIFGIVFFVLPDELGTPIEYGDEQRVFYQEEATEEDARAVGDHLRMVGFFDDAGPMDVFVRRSEGELSVTFILIEGAWDDSRTVELFERMRAGMQARAFEGEPLVYRLCDAELREHRTLRGR